jgi:HTH-type transcriptional regulator / antitoxin HigA
MTTAARRNTKKRAGKVDTTSRRRSTVDVDSFGPRSDAELALAIKKIDELLLKSRPNKYEQALLTVLTHAVERYERHAVKMPAISDVAMLEHLIEANDLTQMALAEETGIAMSTISEILQGKRKMNVAHIRAFAKRFGVKPGAFL